MRAVVLFLHLAVAILPVFCADEAEVTYHLSLSRRHEQYLEVRMEIRGLAGKELELAIPAWNNLYQIRDFARFVSEVRAVDPDGKALPVERVDKQTWKLGATGSDSRIVNYLVYAAQPGSFGAEVTERHAFVHPALVCLYLPRYRGVPHRLRFQDLPETWKVATGLDSTGPFHTATSYDHLIDSPLEAGELEIVDFSHQGTLYQIVVDGRAESFEIEALRDLVRRIVRYQVQLMGKAPFRRFVFLFHVEENGSGGMEHRNSTAIGLTRSRGLDSRAASLTAHEFFHAWNVKRIRPEALVNPDMSREVYTRSLWFSEGTTSYYSLLTLVRAGLIDSEEFLDRVARNLATLYGRSARLHQSLEESSLLTWFDKYPDYRRPETSISYYNKGALISFLLDLKIRHETQNRAGLDEVMRFMDRRYGETGVGFRQGDILAAVESVSGAEFDEFFSQYVSGVEEVPFEDFLGLAGWHSYEEVAEELGFGFLTEWMGETLRVTGVNDGSPADVAGLRTGDEILEIDGRRPEPGREKAPQLDPGRFIRLLVRRNGEERELRFYPGTSPRPILLIREAEDSTRLQRRIREGILRGEAGAPRGEQQDRDRGGNVP